MEAIISIRPKWVDLILKGEKTIEIRKTFPKVKTVYIYVTKAKPLIYDKNGVLLNGKVVAKFLLNEVLEFKDEKTYNEKLTKLSCVSFDELKKYSNGKTIYGLKLSNLEILKKPLSLNDFCLKKECPFSEKFDKNECKTCPIKLEKAPQSWCYCKLINV